MAPWKPVPCGVAAALACALISPSSVHAAESLCDSSFQDCRTPLINLIRAETAGIDVAFWFMEDQRYVNEIIARKNAGVPVRLIVDPRANASYPLNATSLDMVQAAGIPMVMKSGGGIMHWKMMLFAGQNVVEFGSANFSDNAFVPVAPYSNYVGETIFFEDDPAIVDSFKTKFDDLWTDTTAYADYANVTARVRAYPTSPIDPDMNFPPGQDFSNRSVARYNAETQKIDVMMYRVTDKRHSDAMIAAWQRGIPIRYLGETWEYRNVNRLWVSWNMDRMYAAGIPMRVRAHEGQNHKKVVLLYGQGLTIFGSSNWTSSSANSQLEHNYFTTKTWIFNWFADQFERKWNNTAPGGAIESQPFVPLPPDTPSNVSIANGAVGVAVDGQMLNWYGGPWAHLYDVYFGADPNPPLFAANQALGPSATPSQNHSFSLPPLAPGTTYYWKIVSRTAAGLARTGDVWSFTTAGAPPPPPPPPTGATTIVLWASGTRVGDVHGNWEATADPSASGGSALLNPNQGQSKIAPALFSPANYFERTFTVHQGVAYHLWVRLRAQSNAFGNDSVHVQFSESVDSFGTPAWRIGTTSSAEVVLQNGSGDSSVNGWGWADNGWGAAGANIYFAAGGLQTVRVQQREDGAIVDEIVLSPDVYLATAPGPRDDDTTILVENDGSGSPPPPSPANPTIVLWTATTPPSGIAGAAWQMLADGSAAGGAATWNPNASQPKISPAIANPASYIERTFTAAAGVPYHLWVRLRAEGNSFSNDSVHVQFDDSVDSSGAATMRIGSTSSAEMVLQNGPGGAANQSWGWSDNGWGTLGVHVYFATTGVHTLRIQQREDGAIVDQIVLSPNTYLTTPPGPRQNDMTILIEHSGT